MTNPSAFDTLYSELKADVQALASPLFEVSEVSVRKRGAFLPQGAVLTSDREVRLIVAAPDGFNFRAVAPAEVLPLLHQSLRYASGQELLLALAIAEDVTITPTGERSTRAIEVLIEHSKGLVVALYLPFRRSILRGYTFGSMLALPAESEVSVWPSSRAT